MLKSLISSQTLKLNLSILETGVISAAVPVKKHPTKSVISLGAILRSLTFIFFDFAISITALLVIPSRNESGTGVCNSPFFDLKNHKIL